VLRAYLHALGRRCLAARCRLDRFKYWRGRVRFSRGEDSGTYCSSTAAHAWMQLKRVIGNLFSTTLERRSGDTWNSPARPEVVSGGGGAALSRSIDPFNSIPSLAGTRMPNRSISPLMLPVQWPSEQYRNNRERSVRPRACFGLRLRPSSLLQRCWWPGGGSYERVLRHCRSMGAGRNQRRR
jgi:hypothetical protein